MPSCKCQATGAKGSIAVSRIQAFIGTAFAVTDTEYAPPDEESLELPHARSRRMHDRVETGSLALQVFD
jgi:hypothetical protein